MGYNLAMTEAALTPERILEAAEEVLRRYGPGKATVVDVARALGVSHGSVYRHFSSKAALRDAVLRVWLRRFHDPLEAIAAEDAPAADRLRRWLHALSAGKRRRRADDPELFATYTALAMETREVVEEHVAYLAAQVRSLVAQGTARGEWQIADPAIAARAILSATARFHHPAHASEWAHPDTDRDLEEVWALLLRGLTANS